MKNKDIAKGALGSEEESRRDQAERNAYLVQETFAKSFFELVKDMVEDVVWRERRRYEAIVIDKLKHLFPIKEDEGYDYFVNLSSTGFQITVEDVVRLGSFGSFREDSVVTAFRPDYQGEVRIQNQTDLTVGRVTLEEFEEDLLNRMRAGMDHTLGVVTETPTVEYLESPLDYITTTVTLSDPDEHHSIEADTITSGTISTTTINGRELTREPGLVMETRDLPIDSTPYNLLNDDRAD